MKSITHPMLAAAAACAVVAASSASATVVFSGGVSGTTAEVNSADSTQYAGDVSNTDLLNGLTPVFDGQWFTTSGRTPANMADGIHGRVNDVNTLAQTQMSRSSVSYSAGVMIAT